jgi:hypothetical protein
MVPVTSLEFSHVARAVADAARRAGLRPPSFRSPPRLAGAHRTMRRRPDGGLVVAVRIFDRPWLAVVGDLVEGVVVANGLVGPEAQRCRDHLWAAVSPTTEAAA